LATTTCARRLFTLPKYERAVSCQLEVIEGALESKSRYTALILRPTVRLSVKHGNYGQNAKVPRPNDTNWPFGTTPKWCLLTVPRRGEFEWNDNISFSIF
jgi:hypothetical protein